MIGLRPQKAASAGPTAARSEQAHNAPALSYSAYIRSGATGTENARLTIGQLLWNSEMTSVDIALLRRDPAYEPAGGWGWALSRLEFLLTSTLFALFLLAVRRQFRR